MDCLKRIFCWCKTTSRRKRLFATRCCHPRESGGPEIKILDSRLRGNDNKDTRRRKRLFATRCCHPRESGGPEIKILDSRLRGNDNKDTRRRKHQPTCYRRSAFVIMASTLLLTACGWHLQGTMMIPKSLHTLYLTSDDPYGQFTQQFKESLQTSNVNLVSSADQAPYTLAILSENSSTQQTGSGQSQQTRTYDLTYTVTFALKDANGTVIYGPNNVTATEHFSLAPEVLVSDSSQIPTLTQEAQQDAMQSILDRLGSKEIQQAIDQHENQSRTTRSSTTK